MATIKSYTDLQQSKKLAEIIPIKSADMYYCYGMDIHTKEWSFDDTPTIIDNSNQIDVHADIPCWSLAALLEQLPYELCDDDGNSSYLQINKEDDVYQLVYTDPYGDFESIETDKYEYFVDACYEMILKLHELKML